MINRRSSGEGQLCPVPARLCELLRPAWPFIILAAMFMASASVQTLAQGQLGGESSQAAVRAKVEALLGAYETAGNPKQWLSLGSSTVTPILASIAADENALPTRRARSLEGLASLGSGSPALFRSLAYSDQEPLILRMSAVRGLGKLLPDSVRVPALRTLLEANDPQLRGITAEVLAQSPGGCAAIQGKASRESEAWRTRFARGCGGPQAPSGQAPAVAPPLSPAIDSVATSVVTQTIPLGSFAVFTDHLGSPIAVDVPDSAVSIELVGVADPTVRVVVYRIKDPSGNTVYDYGSFYNSIKILPSVEPGSFSVLLPNSPNVPFTSGQWTFYLLAAQQTLADVQVLIKTSSGPLPTTGGLNLNLFFVGVPQLSAQTAPTDKNFQKLLKRVQKVYSQIGVSLGAVNYIDITGSDATRLTNVVQSDLPSLFQLSGNPQASDNAVNIFLVQSIVGGGLGGYIILGESGGIPGAPVRGSTSSGLAVTMANFPKGLESIALTAAHETGHWLGLFHTTESNGLAFDPLPDTPQCTQVPYDTNHDGIMEPQECITQDATDLMFWTSVPEIPANLLSPNQQFVILRNPVVAQ